MTASNPASRPLPDSREWRWVVPRLLAVFLVARLIVVACAVCVEQFARPNPAGPAGSALQYTDRPLLASLTSWDGVYYLGIAADGYRAGSVNGPYPNIVFLPLYPLAVRAVATPLSGDVALAGVLVANAAGLAALFVVYALARRRLGPDAAVLAATVVGLQPGAVAFAMTYSDSLFLLLAVGALLCAERNQRPAAGILAMLAGLTRLQGFLLIAPMLLLFAARDGRKPRVSWLWGLGGPLGVAAFAVLIGSVAGEPFALLTGQSIWDSGVPGAVAPASALVIGAIVYAAVVLVEARLLLDRWRARADGPGVVWALANVAAILVARRIGSLPRYLAPVTQLAEQLAGGNYRRRVVRLVLAGAVVGYTALAVMHFALLLAP